MYKVLLLDPNGYSENARNRLRRVAILDEIQMNRNTLLSEIHQYHGLVLRLGNKIDKEIISQAKNLRVIATNATGTDHIDLEAAESANVSVISLKGEYEFLSTISSTAELTWGLILSLLRNIPSAISDVQSFQWRRDAFVGRDLMGRKLGILGCGRIGSMIANYGLAFGMSVGFFDLKENIERPNCKRFSSIEALFAWGDILTIHLPLNESTKNLVSKHLIDKMPRGSYLVNTSRGAILNEDDLVDALKTGRLSGAALDVVPGELEKNFLSSSKLLEYAALNKNLLITPHIGGASYDAWAKTEDFICEKLAYFLEHSEQ